MVEQGFGMSKSRLRSSPAAVGLTLAILIGSGLGHRSLMGRIDAALNESLMPTQPLSTFPLQLGPWAGRDVPMDENVRRIAGDDDYIHREYRNKQTGVRVNLYVGYIGRPRSRMGHRPDVCYPAHGFEQVSEKSVLVSGQTDTKIPSMLYEFRSPEIAGPRQLVLATYVINGEYVQDTATANDYNIRSPNLFGGQSAYVARIQISIRASGDQDGDLAVLSDFAGRITQPIAAMLPPVVSSHRPGHSRSKTFA